MNPVPVETQVAAVTVYLDRARVTRRGRAAISAGLQELAVDDLPAGLLPESVRAAARASVPARLLGTDVNRIFHSTTPEASHAELQARVEELEEQDATLGKRLEAVATRRRFLQTLAASSGEALARGIAFGRTPVETGAAVGTFLADQLGALDRESTELERERRELQKELSAARSRLKGHQRRAPTERQRVVVSLEAEADGDVELEISYQVTDARWEPLYDVWIEEAPDPSLMLGYLAQVTQQTGEAWTGVELTLSTAKPALSSVLPELHAWYLNAFTPRETPVMRYKAAAAMPVAAPAQVVAAALEEETDLLTDSMLAVEDAPAAIDEGPTVTFRAPGTPDIPSDGSPHKVRLASYDLPARLDYVTAPKLVTQAYRRARAVNSTPAILLPGSASVFTGGEFVGSTRLKTVAPGQELELFLGVDDRIHVERRMVEGTVDKAMLGIGRRLSYAYEVTVTNHHARAQTVTVLDQVPVPRHESIKVRRTETRPAAAEEADLGRLRWELAAAPGQKVVVRFGFTIDSPRDMRLSGLPPLQD